VAGIWKRFDTRDGIKPVLSVAVEDFCQYDLVPEFVRIFDALPVECTHCHKGLIFWEGGYSTANVSKFKKMLASLPFAVFGKYDPIVAVFYFDFREKLTTALSAIDDGLKTFDVYGRTQWRISGKYWQEAYPHFFLSAKELNPKFQHEFSILPMIER
jgi:hypothetical protein